MTIRYHSPIRFSTVLGRRIEGEFSGGQVTGNGGIQLLSEVDRRIGLTRSVAGSLEDPRRSASCGHGVLEMLRQRVYALALGEEDLNDHAELRNDLALRAAVGRDSELASPSTLCGWSGARTGARRSPSTTRCSSGSSRRTRRRRSGWCWTSTRRTRRCTGTRRGASFHGYYGHYCYLPLYVFCGRHLLVSYLRPSGIDGARHAWAVLAMLARALRARWPKVEIVLRADSGFCRHRMLRWCEGNNVGYVVGIGKNNVLMESAAGLVAEAAGRHARTGCRQKLFGSFRYAAASWNRERRVIVKAEHNAKGPNTRFVVTSLAQTDRHLYKRVYCARGDMENRIKNQQLDLFAGPRLLHKVLVEPVPPAALGAGLHAHRGAAPHGAREHPAGGGQPEHHQARPAQGRGGGGGQHAPHPPADEFRLSAPGAVPPGRAAPRLVLTPNSAAPRACKQWGWGECARRTRNTRIRAFPHPKTRRKTPNSPRSTLLKLYSRYS